MLPLFLKKGSKQEAQNLKHLHLTTLQSGSCQALHSTCRMSFQYLFSHYYPQSILTLLQSLHLSQA